MNFYKMIACLKEKVVFFYLMSSVQIFMWFSLDLWATAQWDKETQVQIAKGRKITDELKMKRSIHNICRGRSHFLEKNKTKRKYCN